MSRECRAGSGRRLRRGLTSRPELGQPRVISLTVRVGQGRRHCSRSCALSSRPSSLRCSSAGSSHASPTSPRPALPSPLRTLPSRGPGRPVSSPAATWATPGSSCRYLASQVQRTGRRDDQGFGPPQLLASARAEVMGIDSAFLIGSWADPNDRKTGPRRVCDIDMPVLRDPDRTLSSPRPTVSSQNLGRPVQVKSAQLENPSWARMR
jgi:hypothetical protein